MLYEERKHTALLNCVTTWLYKSTVLMKHRVYWYWNCFGCNPRGGWGICSAPWYPAATILVCFRCYFSWLGCPQHCTPKQAPASTSILASALGWIFERGLWCGTCPAVSLSWLKDELYSCLQVWEQCPVPFPFAVTGASRQHQCCRKPDYLLWFILREC